MPIKRAIILTFTGWTEGEEWKRRQNDRSEYMSVNSKQGQGCTNIRDLPENN